MSALLAGWAAFTGLPRWVHAALAGAIAFALWLHFHDKGVIEKHEAQITTKVQVTISAAAADAHSAITATQTKVEQHNDEARTAAAGSDDPLRAGLDRLRERPGADKPAAR